MVTVRIVVKKICRGENLSDEGYVLFLELLWKQEQSAIRWGFSKQRDNIETRQNVCSLKTDVT
jgi:hypothetical protein